jgi:hypothetical protein
MYHIYMYIYIYILYACPSMTIVGGCSRRVEEKRGGRGWKEGRKEGIKEAMEDRKGRKEVMEECGREGRREIDHGSTTRITIHDEHEALR